MMTGQIGRPGTGLHPLRGQNNVQGASDSGLIPMVFPDYQRVDNPEARARFEKLWGATLDPKPGLTVVEIMHAVLDGKIRGMYIMGENPAMSDPDAHHAREALAKLDCLVVQEIFLTETCYLRRRDPAGDGVAGEGRHGHQHRPHGAARPQGARRAGRGDARTCGSSRRSRGAWASTGTTAGPPTCSTRCARAMNSIAGITWERLEQESSRHLSVREGRRSGPAGGVHRQLPDADRPREARAGGHHSRRRSSPTREYPFVLITGPPARALAHRRDHAPRERARRDRARAGGAPCIRSTSTRSARRPGDVITVESRRGIISLYARADDGTPRGAVFIPFCFYEAAANLLTNPALDPFGKIPEFKYCAVKVMRGGELTPRSSYGGGQALAERQNRRKNPPAQ